MPRDHQIKRAFEAADDAMQGAIGYFLYGIACKKKAPPEDVESELPPDSIGITHDWIRYYNPRDLCNAMELCFEAYHARVALIAVVSAFEAALKSFAERLAATGKVAKLKDGYKDRLKWAFNVALKSTYGTPQMKARIPALCLHVDHARRIRNLWMHNNGLFDARYATDVVQVPGHKPIVVPTYVEHFQKRRRRVVPIVLTGEGFFALAKSHIELLHQLHDTIQRIHFGQVQSYKYSRLKKGIEWQALLLGASERVLRRYRG